MGAVKTETCDWPGKKPSALRYLFANVCILAVDLRFWRARSKFFFGISRVGDFHFLLSTTPVSIICKQINKLNQKIDYFLSRSCLNI